MRHLMCASILVVLSGFTLSCAHKEDQFHLIDETTATSELISCIQLADNDYVMLGVTSDGIGADDVLLVEIGAKGDTNWVCEFGSPFQDLPLGLSEASGSLRVLYNAYYPDSGNIIRLANIDMDGLLQQERSLQSRTSYSCTVLSDDSGNAYILNPGESGLLVEKVDINLNTIWTREFLQNTEPGGLWNCQYALSGSNLFVIGEIGVGIIQSGVISFDGELIGSDQEQVAGFFSADAVCITPSDSIYVIGTVTPISGQTEAYSLLLGLTSDGTIASRREVAMPRGTDCSGLVAISATELLLVGLGENDDATYSLLNLSSGEVQWTDSWPGRLHSLNDVVLTNSGNLVVVGSHQQTTNINHSAMACCTSVEAPSGVPQVALAQCEPWNLTLPNSNSYGLFYAPGSDVLSLFDGEAIRILSPYTGDTLATIDWDRDSEPRSLIPIQEGGLLCSSFDGTYQFYDGNYSFYAEIEPPEYCRDSKPIAWGPEGLVIFGAFSSSSFPQAQGEEGLFLALLDWEGQVVWCRVLQENHEFDEDEVRVNYLIAGRSCVGLGIPCDQLVVGYTCNIWSEDFSENILYRNSTKLHLIGFDMNGLPVWEDEIVAPPGRWFGSLTIRPASFGYDALVTTSVEGRNGRDCMAWLYNQSGIVTSDIIISDRYDEDQPATRLWLADTLDVNGLYLSKYISIPEELIQRINETGSVLQEFIVSGDNCDWYVEDFSSTRDGDIVGSGVVFDSMFVNENIFAAVLREGTTIRNL